MQTINWNDFEKINIRIGIIIKANEFKTARKPAYQLTIDFGQEIGIKKSSAQITGLYTINELVGRQVAAVVNFPPKQIGNFMSECLVLGAYNEQNEVVLLMPEQQVANGSKVG